VRSWRKCNTVARAVALAAWLTGSARSRQTISRGGKRLGDNALEGAWQGFSRAHRVTFAHGG
jgi:hypothetical protein